MKIGEIVQLDPEMEVFGACLAVVSEIKENGRLMVYIQSAGVAGQAYLFVNPGQYEQTGGMAVWVAGL